MNAKFAQLGRFPAPGRILAVFLLLLLLWLPLAVPIATFIHDSNIATIVVMSLLFGEFLILIWLWGRSVYRDANCFKTYGLTFSRSSLREGLIGLGLGAASTLALFSVQVLLGWRSWQTPSEALLDIVWQGLLSALGIGLAEELVFRGWILDELQRDYSFRQSLWANSILYAGLHFLKPLPEMLRTLVEFPGLVLLGWILVWAKRSTPHGHLGLSIGLHAGLVWGYYIVNVGQLTQLSQRVPDWVTGVNGNPIAGVMGLIALAGLGLWVRRRASSSQ